MTLPATENPDQSGWRRLPPVNREDTVISTHGVGHFYHHCCFVVSMLFRRNTKDMTMRPIQLPDQSPAPSRDGRCRREHLSQAHPHRGGDSASGPANRDQSEGPAPQSVAGGAAEYGRLYRHPERPGRDARLSAVDTVGIMGRARRPCRRGQYLLADAAAGQGPGL